MSHFSIRDIWWLWIPVVALAVQLMLEAFADPASLPAMHSESGPHELLQFLIITAAFLISATMLLKAYKYSPWLGVWVGIACVCSLYVAGEEMSWGQHILEWNTPEYWMALNDQGETNFHNTSSWLDQKPRVLLEIGVVIGGLLIPFFMKLMPALLPQRFTMIYPTWHVSVTAGIFLLLKITDKMEDVDVKIFERVSEVQELYLFYFVLLYLVVLRQRILKSSRALS